MSTVKGFPGCTGLFLWAPSASLIGSFEHSWQSLIDLSCGGGVGRLHPRNCANKRPSALVSAFPGEQLPLPFLHMWLSWGVPSPLLWTVYSCKQHFYSGSVRYFWTKFLLSVVPFLYVQILSLHLRFLLWCCFPLTFVLLKTATGCNFIVTCSLIFCPY